MTDPSSSHRPLAGVAGVGVLLSLMSAACLAAEGEGAIEFNRDIRPILSDKCFACHGPDGQKRKADLRLDTREGASSGGAILPGRAEESEVWHRITTDDPDEVMPPPESKLGRLSDAEAGLLRRWIEQGAEYQSHWSLVPLQPIEAQPPTRWTELARNPIDGFVFRSLEREGLEPRPLAARETAIRRVSFDLTGLPPTVDEVDAYLSDERPDAYERLVDRLLESPRYGERMAADWLDLARYADTYGFQVDRDRSVWRWRDWVIDAFNRNLPYDSFITWQLAGDLLPGAGDEQILATAFNRMHQQKVEGGSVEEEFRVEYVADRVHTFGTAFLGLTLECARCHDHKYDPVSQREYFQLFAFFNNIDEAGLYSFFTDSIPTPTLFLPTDAQRQELREREAAVRAEEEALAGLADEREAEFARWLDEHRRPSDGTAPPAALAGEIARYDFDAAAADDPAAHPSRIGDQGPARVEGGNRIVPGRDGGGNAIQFTGDDPANLPFGNFRRHEPFSAGFWMMTPDRKERAVLLHRSRAWTDAASRGYQVLLEDGRISWSLIHFWPGNAVSVRAVEPVPENAWTHVLVASDGSARAEGLRIFIDGKPAAVEVVRDHLTKNITGGGGDNIALGERFRDRGFKGGLIDDVRVWSRSLSALEAAEACRPGTIADLLARPPGALTEAETASLREFFLSAVDPAAGERRAALAAAREARNRVLDGLEEIMVMRELSEPRQAYVLERGQYDQRRDPVGPSTPAALPPLPEGASADRLGLARWLTDPGHPLTARTAVNRFWLACFGRGLVKTAEDFGSQGSRPEHPELLDWLAGEFIRSGWDVKRLMRLIVTSHTYRQGSLGPPGLMADDPENAMLARGPRHRLPAEMIRDNALLAGGLLVERRGGPSVKPYEIEESFKPSPRDHGEGLYRRSLYTYWKRTGPAPAMASFDAVKRDVCVARRERTNTPLQALILLNGVQFVEAARVLGERLVIECGEQPGELVERAFRTLTSRRPDDRETAILVQLYEEQRAGFAEDPAAAEALLNTGDTPRRDPSVPAASAAAAAVVVQALMNFDECVMKR